jgi:hypothetical protein
MKGAGMDRRDWKRHERRKARQQAASEDAARGSRIIAMDFPSFELHCVEVDAEESIPHVVRHVVPQLLSATSKLPIIRTLTARKWDLDDRPLIDIPEARAFFRTLWAEAKQLLRLLVETMHNTPPDDRHGLTQEQLMNLGMGWLDVYCVGTDDKDWSVRGYMRTGAFSTPINRKLAHAELFDGEDRGPFGYTPEDATARQRLYHAMSEYIAAMMLARKENGLRGSVMLLLALNDERAVEVVSRVKSQDPEGAVPSIMMKHPDGTVGYQLSLIEQHMAISVLRDTAPRAAHEIQSEPLSRQQCWVAVIAAGGTQLIKTG